jgi:hypothetical protein
MKAITIDPPPELAMHICIFRSEKQARIPIRRGRTQLSKLKSLLSQHDVRPEKSGLAFGPYRLRHGMPRANDNVEAISAFVGDIDGGPAFEVLSSSLPWHHIAYSTHRHAPDRGMHKYRVVVPYSREVTPAEHHLLWQFFCTHLHEHVDTSCKDPARIYFLPSCPPGDRQRHAFAITHPGAIFEPDLVLKETSNSDRGTMPTEEAEILHTSASLAEAREMLRYVDPCTPRNEWFQILCALANEYGEEARALAHEWSSGSLMGKSHDT